MKATKPKAKQLTARQFDASMQALGKVLDGADRFLLVQLSWSLVPHHQRRAGVLAPAKRFRPRWLSLPRKGGA